MQLHNKSGSIDNTGQGQEGDSPHHQILIRSSLDLNARVQWDTTVRYVDELPHQFVPAYWAVDLRLAYTPCKNLELAVVGQNLMDNRHPEFGVPPARREIQRGIYGKATWRF
jgi:iron complex outermembrane receptor protein